MTYYNIKNVNLTRTKIMATLGPSSDVMELARAGARAFRLNLSYGDIEWHTRMIERVREVEDELGLKLGVVADLRGRKLRVSVSRECELREGQRVVLETTSSLGTDSSSLNRIYLDGEVFEYLEDGV